MKETVVYMGLLVCLVALFLAFFTLLPGCASRDPSVVAASHDLAVCAATAQSWPAYDKCRDEVRARYGRLDGGLRD